MLRHSHFVLFDDIGLQTVFSHKKDISFEERYHIHSLHIVLISADFDIYNVSGRDGSFDIFSGNGAPFI